MASNVNTKELSGLALEIAQNIESINNSISEFKECTKNITTQCETLNSYNGKRVAGTFETYKEYYETGENAGEYKRTVEKYSTWVINGQDELESNSDNLEQILDDIEESISDLKLETSDIELIAETIEGYILQLQEDLGENIDTSILASAFGTLSTGIAYDSYSASNGNFVSTNHLLTEYWTDKTLRFEKNSDGTYTIYQKDDDGNEVAMGYTTALTATLYLKNLNGLVNGNNKSATTDNTTESTADKGDGTVISSSNTKYTTTNKISDETKQEIMEYTDADNSDKEEIYNNMSSEAKSIIDGETVVLNPTDNLETILDKKMDIVIPENAKVSINGSSIVGVSGSVFKYDSDSGTYKLEGATSKYSASYTRAEMLSLKITETKG